MQASTQPAGHGRSFRVSILLIVLAWLLASPVLAQTRPNFEEERERMVAEHIVAEGVTNPRVLASMRTVPRHVFVRADLRKLAYSDMALDLGHKQTISPPFIVAYMTEVIDPQPTDTVLEIGTGSGYQAAVLSSLVKAVYSIEIVEPLGKRAAQTLKDLDYKNVHTKVGDGYLGWPEHAPFDKIIVTCSPEKIPVPLVEQLKEGGKMIIPLGERYQQVFHLLEKKDGKLEQKKLLPTLFVPMTGKSEELRAVLPDPQKPKVVNGSFEESTVVEGQADGWHYQRRGTLKSDGAPEGTKYLSFENSEAGRTAHALQASAIDGSFVGELNFACRVKSNDIHQGATASDLPGCVIYFFDGKRLPIGSAPVGPWLADQDWTRVSRVLTVPPTAREMIVQIGLNGAIGTLGVDGLTIQGVPRAK